MELIFFYHSVLRLTFVVSFFLTLNKEILT